MLDVGMTTPLLKLTIGKDRLGTGEIRLDCNKAEVGAYAGAEYWG